MNKQHKNRNDWPLGFRSALEDNPAALREFENFPEVQQAVILEKAKAINSPFEMQYLINSWMADDVNFPYNYNIFIM